jgi:hypothetical protein
MRPRSVRVQVIAHGSWRFEIFDEGAGGWRVVMHAPRSSPTETRTLVIDRDDGLSALIAEAQSLAMALETPPQARHAAD